MGSAANTRRVSAAPAPAPLTPDLHLAETEPATVVGSPPRRRVGAYAGAALVLALLIPVGLWGHFQATHVLSRNALIRAHLSELGVRGDGVIARIHVDAGDRVRRGDLLASLEDSHLQARKREVAATLTTLTEEIALQRAELDLAQRSAEVTLARAGATLNQRLAEARAAAARAGEAEAQRLARRALAEDGVISTEVMRQAETGATTAQALAEAARAAAAEADEDVRAAELEGASADLLAARLRVLLARRKQTEARLQQVDADIEATRIRAPADGAIVRRLAQPGMAVDTGTPVLSLWLSEDTWVEAWVPEEKVGSFRQGARVQVKFPALPGERFEGSVTRVGLATDFEMPVDYLPQSREARMRPTPQIGVAVRLDTLPALLRPGMSAVVTIPRGDA